MPFNARTRLNLLLLAAVAALALIVYLKPGHQPPPAGTPFIPMHAADVRDIRIASGSLAPVLLHREADGWQMTSPLRLKADDGLIRMLLLDLDTESDRQFPAAGDALSKYGLNPPGLKLWFNGLEVDFGDPAPLDNALYARLGDDKDVHLINARLYYHAQHDVYSWVDKHLLPAGAHIVGLQLPQASLLPDAQGRWQLAPRDDSVSADAIQHLLENWQQASALGIVAIGKQKPEGEVALLLQGTTAPVRFQILKDESFLLLGRPDLGLAYQLDKSQQAELLEFAKTAAPAAATARPATAHK